MIVRNWLLTTVGLISLGIGVVGIFTPLLPTTFFLLVAAACFARSSERLHAWLMGHRWFGPYIRNYRDHRAMPVRSKVATLVALWAAIAFSLYAAPPMWYVRVTLIAVLVGVSAFILRMKTMTPEMEAELNAALSPGDREAEPDRA
jgi:uncharacterized membrane protein YbaN (DUF454 family)